MRTFGTVFEKLNREGVRFVVVGGLAVVLHGHSRFTADLDLIVDLAPEAALRTVNALSDLGLVPRAPVAPGQFADAGIRRGWLREKGMQVFSMWDPKDPFRVVDLFVDNPIDFEELWRKGEVVDLGAHSVRIASIPHLIHLKRLAGRPLDLDDVEHLEEIARLKGGSR